MHARTQEYIGPAAGVHIGELREWKYASAIPVGHQLGANEMLGFFAVLHDHGGGGVY